MATLKRRAFKYTLLTIFIYSITIAVTNFVIFFLTPYARNIIIQPDPLNLKAVYFLIVIQSIGTIATAMIGEYFGIFSILGLDKIGYKSKKRR